MYNLWSPLKESYTSLQRIPRSLFLQFHYSCKTEEELLHTNGQVYSFDRTRPTKESVLVRRETELFWRKRRSLNWELHAYRVVFLTKLIKRRLWLDQVERQKGLLCLSIPPSQDSIRLSSVLFELEKLSLFLRLKFLTRAYNRQLSLFDLQQVCVHF